MFIIKKILGSVLMPLPFFLLISFVGLFFLWRGKRVFTGKILTTLGLIGLTIMSYNPVSRALNVPLNCKYEVYSTNQLKKIGTESETLVKYVVVLAGGHKSDPEHSRNQPDIGTFNDPAGGRDSNSSKKPGRQIDSLRGRRR